MQKINLSDLEMAQLREQLGRLPEPRGGRRQLHPLPTVLTIALAGARGYLAISESVFVKIVVCAAEMRIGGQEVSRVA